MTAYSLDGTPLDDDDALVSSATGEGLIARLQALSVANGGAPVTEADVLRAQAPERARCERLAQRQRDHYARARRRPPTAEPGPLAEHKRSAPPLLAARRTGARARGGGRPKAQAARSSAASGDSGDDGGGSGDPPPPGLRLRRHPRWGRLSAALLRILLREERGER